MATRLPAAPAQYDQAWMQALLRRIELATDDALRAPSESYTVTSLATAVRAIDAGTADLAAIRSVLSTLISDLKSAGRLR